MSAEAVAGQLRFALWAADHNNVVTPAPTRGLRKLKVLRLAIHDIQPADGSPAIALVYADTFLEVVSDGADGINLTEALPQMLCFPATQGEAVAISKLESAIRRKLAATDMRPSASSAPLEDGPQGAEDVPHDGKEALLKAPEEGEVLGVLVGGEEEVTLLTGMDALPALRGRMTCFTGGCIFQCPPHPPLVIDFRSHLDGLWVQEMSVGGRAEDIIVLKGKAPACGFLPATLLGESVHLGIALSSMRESARRHITIRVLGMWEQACREMDIPVGNSGGEAPFPADLHPSYHAHILGPAKHYQILQRDEQVVDALQQVDDRAAAALNQGCALEKLPPFDPSPVEIVLVTGLPGASQCDVASTIVAFKTENTIWKVVQLPLQCGSRVTAQLLDKPLTDACAKLMESAAANVSLRVALVMESFASLASQLGAVAECGPCAAGTARVSNAILCCNSAYLRCSHPSMPPGFLEQLHRGLVDKVVVSGPAPPDVAKMLDLVQLRLPGVPVIRAVRGQLIRSLDALLAAPDKQGAMAAARRCYWPPSPAVLPTGAMQCVFVSCRGTLDIDALRDALHRWGIASHSSRKAQAIPLQECGSARDARHLLCVRALVRSAAGEDLQEVFGLRHEGARISKWPLAAAPWAGQPSRLLAPDQIGAELLFFGTGVLPADCEALVATCGVKPQEAAQPRTLSSVTAAERQAIERACRGDDLPEGYFYDGVSYLDPFGDRLKEHPRLAEHLEQYLREQNQAIAEQQQQHASGTQPQPLEVEAAAMVTLD